MIHLQKLLSKRIERRDVKGAQVGNYYWSGWYSGWGWVLWFGFVFLMVSSFGNWNYTYRAHRRFGDGSASKDALSILNERYARGEIKHDEYIKMKSHILSMGKIPEDQLTKTA